MTEKETTSSGDVRRTIVRQARSLADTGDEWFLSVAKHLGRFARRARREAADVGHAARVAAKESSKVAQRLTRELGLSSRGRPAAADTEVEPPKNGNAADEAPARARPGVPESMGLKLGRFARKFSGERKKAEAPGEVDEAPAAAVTVEVEVPAAAAEVAVAEPVVEETPAAEPVVEAAAEVAPPEAEVAEPAEPAEPAEAAEAEAEEPAAPKARAKKKPLGDRMKELGDTLVVPDKAASDADPSDAEEPAAEAKPEAEADAKPEAEEKPKRRKKAKPDAAERKVRRKNKAKGDD